MSNHCLDNDVVPLVSFKQELLHFYYFNTHAEACQECVYHDKQQKANANKFTRNFCLTTCMCTKNVNKETRLLTVTF